MVALRAIQHTCISVVQNTLFFPVWWYTGGAMRVGRFAFLEIQSIFESLRIPTLFRFLLQPMFGLTDPASRVISICVRIVHFFLLFIIALVLSLFWCVVWLCWLLLPVVTVYQYWFHFFA